LNVSRQKSLIYFHIDAWGDFCRKYGFIQGCIIFSLSILL